uniref:Uncharacterized protein n=1 Tax=Nitzschia sp. IriIs04 TaxID=1444690 RepID=A0A0S3QPL5_9STRA|nr:hypothetical protein [Nitzschia sp. IriIs04]YP_009193357.1 hypothetical protein [Nitzschia sp. IriIs04]BAT70248.1 hypothetical protein [Nitzschia sp. IriIs04]BAT70282.1 hypothetical protein [Nitzschia sp. IriIs04]
MKEKYYFHKLFPQKYRKNGSIYDFLVKTILTIIIEFHSTKTTQLFKNQFLFSIINIIFIYLTIAKIIYVDLLNFLQIIFKQIINIIYKTLKYFPIKSVFKYLICS